MNNDFTKKVIERSNNVPVVVDFWAPWCGPCQFLGPVIGELAGEANGRWELVKINTDENPDISAKYGIRGIPAVKMFHKGKVIAEFTGALPKHNLEKWLDENIPDERAGLVADFARQLHTVDDKHPVISRLEDFVDKNPDLHEARLLLARELVTEMPDKASELVEPIRADSDKFNDAEDIRSIAKLMICEKNGNPAVEDMLLSARMSMKQKDYDQALDSLINAVMIDKSYCEDLPRKASIALFHWLGPRHELTAKYRRRFDMALY